MHSVHSLDDPVAGARWEALRAASPQRTPFAVLPYVRAVATAAGCTAEMHLVGEDGEATAGALVLWRQRGPYRQVVLPPLTPYAALLTRTCAPEADVHARRAAFEGLLAALEARFHALRFALPPAFADVRPAQWRGWAARPFYTYVLPLGDADAVLARWSPHTRRTYRKDAGAYRVEEQPGAAAAVAELCAAGYARHGRRPPLPPGAMARLIEAVQTAGHARLFTATAGGRAPEAGLAVLHDGRDAAYWVAGSTPGPAMTVLLGDVLPRLHAGGLTGFDFVGANTPSIAEFKRRLGPVLQPYYRIERYTRPELGLLFRLLG